MQASRKRIAVAVVALALIAAVAVAIVAGTGGETEDADTSAPAEPLERPSFVRSASSNIYVVDVADRSVDQLTRNDAAELAQEPAWSAGGGIVFTGAVSPDEDSNLFVVDPDGSPRQKVRSKVPNLSQATWSPDGRRIAAVRFGHGIHVLDRRSGAARRLRATSEVDGAPAWAPDGDTIVFQRQVSATNWELYSIDSSGRGLRRLTRDPLQQIGPAWSPDGSRIAFGEQQRNGNWAVGSMRRDGSDRRLLTDRRLSAQDPAWSPDGQRIAFVLQGRTRDSVAVIDVDAGRPVPVAPRTLIDSRNPSWSPNGDQIAFTAHRAERPPPGP